MIEILDESAPESMETFRSFYNKEIADGFAAFLDEKGIPYNLEENSTLLGSVFVGSGTIAPFVIKIYPQNFKKVNKLIENQVLNSLEIDPEHYLYSFTIDELYNVLRNSEDWNVEDFSLAKRILIEKGEVIPDEFEDYFNETIDYSISAEKKASSEKMALYLLGIVVGLFMLSYLFLLAGTGMGLYYWKDNYIDPAGNRLWTFDSKTRRKGMALFIVGALGILTVLAIQFVFSIETFEQSLYF